jgi:hypothetical protein
MMLDDLNSGRQGGSQMHKPLNDLVYVMSYLTIHTIVGHLMALLSDLK